MKDENRLGRIIVRQWKRPLRLGWGMGRAVGGAWGIGGVDCERSLQRLKREEENAGVDCTNI